MLYKIYKRYALSGVVIEVKEFESKNKFYEYIGRLYCTTLEKIERIDYEVLTNKER